jgi:hypothetical protein
MTKVIKVTMIALLGSGVLYAGAKQLKMYGMESGKIDYTISGSGNIMGVTTKTAGKKRVIFDKFGARSLTEENRIQKTVIGEKSNVDKSHNLDYLDGAMLYSVDLEQKRITRMKNPALMMMNAMGGENSAMEMGEMMLKQMGGKKTGTDKVLGYTCDVWEAMGTKQCIYKGIPLKVESDVMGIKNTEVATKAEFDISLSDDDFKLPDFPVYDMHGNKVDKNKLDAMDKKSEIQSEKDFEEMAVMRASVDAAKQSAGIKDGEIPTQAQEKKMMDATMDAMWPRIKKKILAEGKIVRFSRECLGDADTLKEANICNDKANAMGGEDEGSFEVWSPASKKKMLGFMDQGIERLKCMEKANSMQEMQQCIPQE